MQQRSVFVSADLMPASWHRRDRWCRHLAGLTALAILLSSIILAAGTLYSRRAASVTRQLAHVSQLARQAKSLRAENEALERQISAIEEASARLGTYSRATAWARLLDWLAQSVPETTFLTSLATARPPVEGVSTTPARASVPWRAGAAGAEGALATPGTISLEGLATDQKALNELLESLAADQAFAAVTLLGTKRTKIGNLEGLGFSVSCSW